MKKFVLLLLFASFLFADEMCDLAVTKIDRSYSLMTSALENRDMVSLERSFNTFKIWADVGVLYCSEARAKILIESKANISKKVKDLLDEN